MSLAVIAFFTLEPPKSFSLRVQIANQCKLLLAFKGLEIKGLGFRLL